MKSTKTVNHKAGKFPQLMESRENGSVVLFTMENSGVVVNSGRSNGWNLGFSADNFKMEYFYPFDGTITLTN